MIAPLLAWLTRLAYTMTQRARQNHGKPPDRGGHAVEYAIGIAGSLAIIGGIIVALRTGLHDVVSRWIFPQP